MAGTQRNTTGPTPLAKKRLAESVRKAEDLARKGRVDEAARRLEEAVTAEPRNSRYLLQLAGLRRGQGRLDDAIDLAARASTLSGRNEGAHELLLQLYLETGQYQEVINRGKVVVKSSPRNLYARDLMGVAYLQLGLLDKALQVTNELVHLEPMDASNHFKRAVLFQQKGDLAKAIREFGRVVELDPEGEMGEEARDAISWLDSFTIRQIVALAMEDIIFRAKLMRDVEAAAIEKGFFLSSVGLLTLRQIDFDRMLDPNREFDPPTYH